MYDGELGTHRRLSSMDENWVFVATWMMKKKMKKNEVILLLASFLVQLDSMVIDTRLYRVVTTRKHKYGFHKWIGWPTTYQVMV